MDLDEWIDNKLGILSIDADFFGREEEQQLAPCIKNWVLRKVGAGVQIVFRDEHVDLIKLVSHPVNFIINFDYHMDCRIEFLYGGEPKTPPCSGSLFESLLSYGLTEKYIWALPNSRSRQASLVYSSAFVGNGQPLLTRIHCVSGRYALERILDRAKIGFIFVCRSPDYATAETDAILDSLTSLVALSSCATSQPK